MGNRRQILTFLFGVLFPGISLVVLGLILVQQSNEIASQRSNEMRVLKAREVADLMGLWLDQAYEHVLDDTTAWHLRHPMEDDVLLAGVVERGAYRLPALEYGIPPLDTEHEAFKRSVRRQLVSGRSKASVVAQIEQRVRQEAEAFRRQELLLEMGRLTGQEGAWSRFVGDQRPLLDGTGTPFVLYAIDQTLAGGGADVCQDLGKLLATDIQFSMAAWTYFKDVANRADCNLDAGVAAEAALLEQLGRRNGTLPFGANGASWVAVDSNWLVRLADPRIADAQPILALPVATLVELLEASQVADIRFAPQKTGEDNDWESLSPLFPTGQVRFASVEMSDRFGNWMLYAAVFIILSMTTGGTLLLWQDSRRDKRLRQLQNQFVASVSHELRTPLTSIRIFSEAMLQYDSMDATEQRKGLGVIAYESGRLSRMLNNVLSASRLESTSYAFQMEPGDLADAAESAWEAMRMEFENAGVGLERSLSMARATFDTDALEQVILNLLSNALKYGVGSKAVELATWEEDGFACLRVADQGPGIPEDARGRLFERFFRSESNRHSVVGTGLGLWLVKEILDAHGGQIDVDSRPGEGASFVVRIPVNR